MNNLKMCMQKLEITLDFLKAHQIENNELNKIAHNEIIEKIDAWAVQAEKNYAKKWVESELTEIKKEREKRNYDWLKYAIVTAIGFVIALLLKTLI